MAFRKSFLNPVRLVVAAVVVVAGLIALGSLGRPNMGALPPSPVSGAMGGDGYYAVNNEPMAQGQQPALEMQEKDQYGATVDDISLGNTDGTGVNTQDGRTRVILKSASLRLVVDAADSSLTAISNMAEAMGGWVVTSSTSMVTTAAGQSVAQGSITIRVPSDKLDEALGQIKSGAGKVEYESVSGQDVTQQYVDLKSRLTNLEAAEVQLRAIMEDARKTEDVLSVYNQLVSTRGEIEQIRGQIQYYDEASAYSSISVDLIPTAIDTPVQIVGWSPGHTVENALATLVNVLQAGADLVITVAVLVVPLGLIALIPLWFVRRAWKRRNARQIQGASAA